MARPNPSNVYHFHSKIVGVTYKNPDGSDRQKFISKCQLFETLVLDHEEDNAHDPNAVRVCRENGQQLGYLNTKLAEEIVLKSEKGYRFAAFIKDITGKKRKGQSLGVNLLIVQADPGIGDHHVKKYVNQLLRDDPELEGAKVRNGCLGQLVFPIAMMIIGMIRYFHFTGRK
jgi:HIRAN domain